MSKTDPFREGAVITLQWTEDDLRMYSNRAVGVAGVQRKFKIPWLLQSGAPLTHTRLVKVLITVLSELGLEVELFLDHSFRKSATTMAAARDIFNSQIKVLG